MTRILVIAVALFWAGEASAAGGGLVEALMQTETTTAKQDDDVEEAVEEVFEDNPLIMNGDPVEVDVMDLFDGVDEDTQFRANSSDTSVVEVDVTPNPRVVHTPRGPGTATITVRGGNAMVSYDVTVFETAASAPALPLFAQGLLAAILLGIGTWRRHVRRRG